MSHRHMLSISLSIAATAMACGLGTNARNPPPGAPACVCSAVTPATPCGSTSADATAISPDANTPGPCFNPGQDFRTTVEDDDHVTVCGIQSGECRTLVLSTGLNSIAASQQPEAPSYPSPRLREVERLSGNGRFMVYTTLDTVRVCKSDDSSSCTSFWLKTYKPHPDAKTWITDGKLAASVSPDGKTALVLLYEKGAGNAGVTFATYDVATGKRLKSSVHPTDEFVREMIWVGDRVLFDVCVEAGPWCGAMMLDPATGKVTDLQVNVVDATPPFIAVDDTTAVMIDKNGSILRFFDMKSGQLLKALDMPFIGSGVSSQLKNGKLFVTFQPPDVVAVAMVDVAKKIVLKSAAFPADLCP